MTPQRVVLRATQAAVGRACLQHIIDHPGLELVGVAMSGSDEERLDASETLGHLPPRVVTTTAHEAIVALDADVVIHADTPFSLFDQDVARLVASGKTVISTVAYFSTEVDGNVVSDLIEQTCSAGRSGSSSASWARILRVIASRP